MRKVIKRAGVVLAAATAIFVGVLATAQTNDRAYVTGPSFAALDTAAKRTATQAVIAALWSDVASFSDVQALKCWQSENGPLCWLEHDRDVSTLSDQELWDLAQARKVTPDTATTLVRTPPADATGAGLGSFATTVLGVSAGEVASVRCVRDSDPDTVGNQPGCNWHRLKTASLAQWASDWKAGLVVRTVGVVADP